MKLFINSPYKHDVQCSSQSAMTDLTN